MLNFLKKNDTDFEEKLYDFLDGPCPAILEYAEEHIWRFPQYKDAYTRRSIIPRIHWLLRKYPKKIPHLYFLPHKYKRKHWSVDDKMSFDHKIIYFDIVIDGTMALKDHSDDAQNFVCFILWYLNSHKKSKRPKKNKLVEAEKKKLKRIARNKRVRQQQY